MNKRLILVVLMCCLSTTAMCQNSQKNDATVPLLSEYFNLDVVDTPKNIKRILRRYPCWQVTNFAFTNVVDGVHNVDKEVFGGPEYPLQNVFVFKSKGYWRYSVSPTHTFPFLDTQNPILVVRYAPYENQESGQPLQVIMCGKDNKYVIGFQAVTYDKDGNRQPTNSFSTYLIEPASRKKLKQMKSLVKKAALVVQYNKEIREFLD